MEFNLSDRLESIENTLRYWGGCAEPGNDFGINWKEQIDGTQESVNIAAEEAKGLPDEIARREVRKALVVVGKCLNRARVIYPMRQLAKTAQQFRDLNMGRHLLYIIPECQQRLADARVAVESMETAQPDETSVGEDAQEKTVKLSLPNYNPTPTELVAILRDKAARKQSTAGDGPWTSEPMYLTDIGKAMGYEDYRAAKTHLQRINAIKPDGKRYRVDLDIVTREISLETAQDIASYTRPKRKSR